MGETLKEKLKSQREKPHNHFPQGKTGYVPISVGITNLSILRKKK